MSVTLPIVVQELVDAANAAHDAAKAMKNCKDAARKISKVALEIATSVENTAAVALHRGDANHPAIATTAALGATRDVFVQCASFMRDMAGKDAFSRHFKKGLTADTVSGYLAAVEGLRELLKIQNHACGLLLEPFDGLGIDGMRSKEIITANIKTIDAAYDGLKSTLNVMVNITDGLPWPPKAAPQTFLYILGLFEECQAVRPRISFLLHGVQSLWTAVEHVSKKAVGGPDGNLLRHLSGFFETLQRIAIRLHIVLRVGQVRRAMAIHTVRACLDLEQGRLNEAREDIMLAFQAETVVGIYELKDKVGRTAALPSLPLVSDVSISTTLPAKPVVLHGRDEFVSDSVQLLTAPGTASIAILGSGGMGKTTVALAVLYDSRLMERFGGGRLFLSCEALVDADAIVVSLAKLLGLPASGDLLTTLVSRLTAVPRVLLVLDNLETVWLAGGAPVAAVDELLGRLAQIPSLSLVITCRGIVLPQLVDWSNANTAALEPFSLEAALETFQDRAGRRLAGEEEVLAKQLLDAVDRMPLAVSLLGQLARRGNSVSELLDRWNREHSALLQTHGAGRINNVEISIELSIKMLCAADASQESLKLLSLCSMLPDGLRPEIFDKLRTQFKQIDRAKDNLTAYALANLGGGRILKTLSPIRHLVQDRHFTHSNQRDALYSIYFDIAMKLPTGFDELYTELAAEAKPEMGNLSSLLLTLVSKPTYEVVWAVIRFTDFACLDRPTMTVASALLSYLEPYREWRAYCLLTIGNVHTALGNYRPAIESFTIAAELFLQVGIRSSAALCKYRAGDPYYFLAEYDQAESLLNEARAIFIELGDELAEARCRQSLGRLMRIMENDPAAIEHLTAARQTFAHFQENYETSRCTHELGVLYFDQGDFESATAELEGARTAFVKLGHRPIVSEGLRFLSRIRCRKGEFTLAEHLLWEAEALSKETDDRFSLAECAFWFGYLRRDQGRYVEAIVHFNSARALYEALQMQSEIDDCCGMIEWLESTVRPLANDPQ